MSFAVSPYAIQADSYGAEIFRQAVCSTLPPYVNAITNGQGGIVNPSDLTVTAGSGNSVNVAAGQCWVAGDQGASQSMYYGYNNATVNLTITPNATNPLVAVVTASVNDQAYSGNPGVSNNSIGFLVTQGTAAASPTFPTIPNNSLVLASIFVPANASSSSSYTIVQGLGTISGTTLSAPVGQTTAPTIGAPSGRIWANSSIQLSTSPQVVVLNATTHLRGGMGVYFGRLLIPVTGLYQVNYACGYGNSAGSVLPSSGFINAMLYHNSTSVSEASGWGTSGTLPTLIGSDVVQCSATDTLSLYANGASNTFYTYGGASSSAYTYLSATLVSR